MLGRRDLMRLFAWSGISGALPRMPLLALAACGSEYGTDVGPPLSEADKSDLAVLADAVIPPDPESPGGAQMGAIAFIERLFESSANVYAGGPFSGRLPFVDDHGGLSGVYPPNDFLNFIELDRVHAAAWKLRIEGGPSLNPAFVAPVVGLRAQVKTALADARDSAGGKALADLDEAGRAGMLRCMDAANRDFIVELVIQACFAPPEYGGNVELAGWKLCNFEGDSQPLGYSLFDATANTYRERADAPMSGPNPGPDPAPLDDDTKDLISVGVQLEGGKVFY